MSSDVNQKLVPGMPPGALLQNNSAKTPNGVDVVLFQDKGIEERSFPTAAEAVEFARSNTYAFLWLNVSGLADLELIGTLAKEFNLHPLAVEDSVNISERPKVDNYGDMLFIALKLPQLNDNRISFTQLSLFLRANVLVSFQEMVDDALAAIRFRVHNDTEFFSTRGVDYLMYTMIDDVVDHYFPFISKLAEKEDLLEDEVIGNSERPALVTEIYRLKRDLREARRAIWPLRDLLNTLTRDNIPQISREVRPFFRDCLDHVTQVQESLDGVRDGANGLMEMHDSATSTRMNEIMKVLTVISTLFTPLMFITGLYGMNFQGMPELTSSWGYPGVLVFMAVLFVFMLYVFYRVGWISWSSPKHSDKENKPSSNASTRRRRTSGNNSSPAMNGRQALIYLQEWQRRQKKAGISLPPPQRRR